MGIDNMRTSRNRNFAVSVLLAIFAIFVICGLPVLCISAKAASDVEGTPCGDFTVAGGTLDEDYTYADHVLTIKSSTPLTISGETTEDTILVQDGVKANLTFDGLNIDVSSKYGVCAVRIDGVAELTLTLKGENVLNSGRDRAGLEINENAALVITESAGSLGAKGGYDGTGIGGTRERNGGAITINGGTIKAEGGAYASGIGNSPNREITINDGSIEAHGGDWAAAIGGAYRSAGGTIILNGGKISCFPKNMLDTPLIGRGAEGDLEKSILIIGENFSYTQDSYGSFGQREIACGTVINYGKLIINNAEIEGNVQNYGVMENNGAVQGNIYNYGELSGGGKAQGEPQTKQEGKDLTISGGMKGLDYTYADNVLTILKSTPLTISGETTEDTILVQDGVKANLTFDGLNIDVSGKYGACAVRIDGVAELMLTLKGENILNSNYFRAGLEVGKDAFLTITEESNGSLEALSDNGIFAGEGMDGGGAGAGIGSAQFGGSTYSGVDESCGTITINGGEITAKSYLGAGIGAGHNGEGGNITINGGNITAESVNNGAIGGGYKHMTGSVTINGGHVLAKSRWGAGIGRHMNSDGGTGLIKITNGVVEAESTGAPGIGVTDDQDAYNPCKILITGGEVSAIGGEKAAGIGGKIGYSCSGYDIVIEGGKVTATGGKDGVGIGGGYVEDNNANIEIKGGTVTAIGGEGAADIATGQEGEGGKLTFGENAEYTISKKIVSSKVTNYGILTNSGEIVGDFDNYNQYISSVGTITGQVRTTVKVYRNRNGETWDESGYNCTLKTAPEGTVEFDEQSSEPLVKMGTYNIYESGADTGRTVEVGYNPVKLTLDYYTVDFCDGKDESVLPLPQQQTVLGGKTVSKPDLIEEPSKTGYEFTGWSSRPNETEGDNFLFPLEIKGKTNVYACWQLKQYNISYILGEGTDNVSNPDSYTIEDLISLNEPKRKGYEFEGWTYVRGDEKGETPKKKLTLSSGGTGDITFTAHWKAIEYKISYNLGDGKNDSSNPNTYTVEDEISLNEPTSTREGYEFEGWTYERGSEKTESPEKELILPSGGTGEITFSAHWKATEYKINYELDGGTNDADNPTTYTVEQSIKLNEPKRKGYEFEGWTYVRGDDKGEAPEKKLTLPSRGTGDITFTAHWKAIPPQPTTEESTEKPTEKPTEQTTESKTEQIADMPPAPSANVPEKITAKEKKENSSAMNRKANAGWKGNRLSIKWGKVKDAEGYDIFVAQCGKSFTKKSLVKTVKGQTSSVKLAKIAGKKLSDEKNYKIKISAYKKINGKKVYIGNSKIYHVAGKKNKTYTNAKKIKVSKKKYTLKRGRTVKINAKIVKESSRKKLLPKAHGAALRYESTNEKIATVTAKGKIKAKRTGTCYIYITALNGVQVKVTVTVK